MCWERDCNQLLSSDVLSLLQRKAACLPSVGLRHLIVVTPQPVIGPGASPAEVLRPDSIAEQASSHGVGTKDGSQCSSAAPVGPMDGWMVSAQRLQQRVQLIQTLQHLAGTRRLRVSLLSGSGAARACWVGKLHRQPKEGLKEDACFMQQVGMLMRTANCMPRLPPLKPDVTRSSVSDAALSCALCKAGGGRASWAAGCGRTPSSGNGNLLPRLQHVLGEVPAAVGA